MYVLVRAGSTGRLDDLIERWGALLGVAAAKRVQPVIGDLRRPLLGVEAEQTAELRGKIQHFFHLAAIYDMTAPAEQNTATNVGGTTHAVELARALEVKRLHHVSSIAVAGEYRGRFGRRCSTRGRSCPRPITARSSSPSGSCASSRMCPGACTGRGSWSETRRPARWTRSTGRTTSSRRSSARARLIPEWMPLVGLDLGKTNVVPVDWVAGALDHIAHEPDLDGRAFHLTDPRGQKVDELYNEFASAAHAPKVAVSVDKRLTDVVPKWPLKLALALPPLHQAQSITLRELGIPARGDRAHGAEAGVRHARGGQGAAGLGAGEPAAAARLRAAGCGTTGSARWTPASRAGARCRRS